MTFENGLNENSRFAVVDDLYGDIFSAQRVLQFVLIQSAYFGRFSIPVSWSNSEPVPTMLFARTLLHFRSDIRGTKCHVKECSGMSFIPFHLHSLPS